MKTVEEYLNHLIEENQYGNVEVHAGLQLVIDAIESYAKEHAIVFAEHTLKKAGYPKDLQPYVGLPGMYKKWITNK